MQQPTLISEAGAIRLALITPATRLGFGPLSIDLFAQIAGASLAELLEPVLEGAVIRRPSPAGASQEIYPLALPDGEGAAIPIPPWGELGFRNDYGALILTVPQALQSWALNHLRPHLAGPPRIVPSLDGTARVVELPCTLRPGGRVSLTIPKLGEVAIETR